MSRWYSRGVLLALLTSASAIVAMAVGAVAPANGAPSARAAAEAMACTINIGSVVDLSGDLAAIGKPDDTAVRLGAAYAQTALEKAGMNVQVKVFTEDTQGTAAAAAEAATKLIQANNADVIIGPASTEETIPMVQSAEIPTDVPQITMASSPRITDVKDSGLLFRTVPSDNVEAINLVRLAQKKFGKHATLNAGARNDPAGSAFLSIFTSRWKAGGGKINVAIKWNPDQPTYDTEAQKLASGHPDGWFIYDFPGTWQKFEPALVRTGLWNPAKTVAGDPLEILPPALAKKAAGVRGLYIGSGPSSSLAAFNKLWNAKTHHMQQVYAEPHSFDAVMLAVLAAVKGGSCSGHAIARNLSAVSGPPGKQYTFQQMPQALHAVMHGKKINYQGASGAVDFDAKGDITNAFYTVWQIQDSGTPKITGTIGGATK